MSRNCLLECHICVAPDARGRERDGINHIQTPKTSAADAKKDATPCMVMAQRGQVTCLPRPVSHDRDVIEGLPAWRTRDWSRDACPLVTNKRRPVSGVIICWALKLGTDHQPSRYGPGWRIPSMQTLSQSSIFFFKSLWKVRSKHRGD